MNYCGNITKSVMLWEIFVDLLMVRTRTRTIEDRSGPVLSGPVLVLEFPEDFRTGLVLVLSKIDPRTGLDRTLKHYSSTSFSGTLVK